MEVVSESAPVGAVVEEAYAAALEILDQVYDRLAWSKRSRSHRQEATDWMCEVFGIQSDELALLAHLTTHRRMRELVSRLEQRMPTPI